MMKDNRGKGLKGLSSNVMRDQHLLERQFNPSADRELLWKILETNDFKNETLFPNEMAIIQFIYDSTTMYHKMKQEDSRAYISKLEQTVIDKRTIIENQERELVKLRTEKQNGWKNVKDEGPQLREVDSQQIEMCFPKRKEALGVPDGRVQGIRSRPYGPVPDSAKEI